MSDLGALDLDAACRADRVAALRWTAGRMLASPHATDRWFGERLLRVLGGADPLTALGLRPPRGSHRTLRHVEAVRQRDAALLTFAAAIGHDGRALAMLRGELDCPIEHVRLRDRARALGCPTSPNATGRARYRMRIAT